MVEKDPFDGLSVTFHWSEAPISDFQGNRYEDDQTLQGEKAYEFLVQLNRADKEAFQKKIIGEDGYDKTKVDIRLHDFSMTDMRIDLGDLEFHSAKTIADALDTRLPAQARGCLRNPEYMKACETTQEECRKILYESINAVATFREQEEAYLKDHPEIQAINEEQPSSFYTYLADRSTFNQCKAFGLVIEKQHPENLAGCVLLTPIRKFQDRAPISHFMDGNKQIDLSHIEKYQEALRPLGEQVVFTSHLRPYNLSYGLKNAGNLHVQPILTPKEVEAIRDINESITLKDSVSGFDDREEDHVTKKWSEPSVFHGINAILNFARNHINTYESFSTAYFLPEKRVELQMGDKTFQMEYLDQPNAVSEALGGRYLPEMPKDLEDKLKTAWAAYVKYEDDVDTPCIFSAPCPATPYPADQAKKDMTKQFKSYYGTDNKFSSANDKHEAICYYLEYASLDQTNDTPEKLIRSAFHHMAEDGIDKRKAGALLKHAYEHPQYYEDIGNALLSKDKALNAAFKNARTKVEGR